MSPGVDFRSTVDLSCGAGIVDDVSTGLCFCRWNMHFSIVTKDLLHNLQLYCSFAKLHQLLVPLVSRERAAYKSDLRPHRMMNLSLL
jgi:hypothetical protein